jgi:hypothetical protein
MSVLETDVFADLPAASSWDISQNYLGALQALRNKFSQVAAAVAARTKLEKAWFQFQ